MQTVNTAQSRRRWLALALLCAAESMVVVDLAIVNVALPAIQEALAFSRSRSALGRHRVHADLRRFSPARRAPGGHPRPSPRLSGGSGDLHVASLACGLAESPGALISARALQGLGGALLSPAALSVIGTLFPRGIGTEQSARDLGRRRRGLGRTRRSDRWRGDGCGRLGVDLSGQHPGRNRGARSRRPTDPARRPPGPERRTSICRAPC